MATVKCCDICERPLTKHYMQIFFNSGDDRELFSGSIEGHFECLTPERIKEKYLKCCKEFGRKENCQR